jgi:hypothetical protein
VIRTVVIEVVVVRLEYTPIVRIFFGLVGVLPEQDSVLKPDEEIVRGAGLTPDVVEYGTDIDIQVRHLRHHPAESSKIVGVPTHVRSDEGRLRIPAKKIVPLLHQLLEVGVLSGGHATSRK